MCSSKWAIWWSLRAMGLENPKGQGRELCFGIEMLFIPIDMGFEV